VEEKSNLSVIGILRKIDTPSVLFFLGILVAISSLQSAGHLTDLAGILRERLNNVYAIDFAIGLLSAIVDNVPLVAASMGMYDVTTPAMLASTPPDQLVWAKYFVQDGRFWEFLAYCAGTGGSILIIGSAAGVAVMGLEKIDFFWYLRKIGSLALVGYIAGAATYLLLM
jgi:Na+/H+ antiporter NhaD/arsenite permease-like protein